MEAERKKFYKKLISYCIFFNNKKCFLLLTCKVFFYLIQTHAISSQRSQILRRTDTSCLCNIGTRSKPCDVSWSFWVYLYQTIQYKLFQELRIHLTANSYLWSLHLVVNIVKAMFKSIFESLIFTPCCKYNYSKNNVKFLKLTSSEISLKAKFAFDQNSFYLCFKIDCFCYFWSNWLPLLRQSKRAGLIGYCMFMNENAKNSVST